MLNARARSCHKLDYRRVTNPSTTILSPCLQKESLEDALRQLWVLGALDEDGTITAVGRRMVALPLDPALARALLEASELGCVPDMLTVVAMLSAESIFMGNRLAAG